MFENKKVLILGLARSGYYAALILAKRGNEVYINDGKKEESFEVKKLSELRKLGCKLVLGRHPVELLDQSFAYVIKSPGIRNDHIIIKRALELEIPVINEVEMAYQLLPEDITLIGITGTNGKTTTTTLTYEILKEAYPERVHLAGNIGYPLCSILDQVKKDDIIVMEVSCQQSVNLQKFHPHIGLITNFSPAHIDFFTGYDEYKQVKSRMFYNQTVNDIAIINGDNQEAVDQLSSIQSQKLYFSSTKKMNGYITDDAIYYRQEKIIDTKIVKIPGRHNLENLLGAIMISKELGVSNQVIEKVASNFRGVTHRLEYVRTFKGVKYYNDTEATNIKCTQIALSSFSSPTIIILGGLERGQNFDDLIPFISNVKAIIGIGECRNRVLEFGNSQHIDTFIYEHLKDGFSKIQAIAQDGDVVLLSPASASWDQYKECEVRGDEFKDLVNNLK